MSGNTITRRDEQGRIVEKELDKETASAMGKRRWAKGREGTASTLLQEAGYDGDNTAPEHLKVLAEIAASKAAGSVAAMRDFLKLTGKREVGSVSKPAPGTICPLCNELVFTDFRPNSGQLEKASAYLELHRGDGSGSDE